jgi:hypothetical protein
MVAAVESPDGFDQLRALVQNELESGAESDALLADLDDIRRLVDGQTEDGVLDVMDLLVGWCAPEARLRGPDSTA